MLDDIVNIRWLWLGEQTSAQHGHPFKLTGLAVPVVPIKTNVKGTQCNCSLENCVLPNLFWGGTF